MKKKVIISIMIVIILTAVITGVFFYLNYTSEKPENIFNK